MSDDGPTCSRPDCRSPRSCAHPLNAVHGSTLVPASLPDGFEVIEFEGAPYLRVIAEGRCMLSTPTSAAMLHELALGLLGAVDAIKARGLEDHS